MLDGGIEVVNNDNMCYIDLFDWQRLLQSDQVCLTGRDFYLGGAGGSRASVSQATADQSVVYLQKPAHCLTLECDPDCDCGFVWLRGGPFPVAGFM